MAQVTYKYPVENVSGRLDIDLDDDTTKIKKNKG